MPVTLTELESFIVSKLSPFFEPAGPSPVVADLTTHGGRNSDVDVPLVDGWSLTDDVALVAPWRFRGRDTVGLHGIAPTRRDVIVRGVTICPTDDLEQSIQYIDWLNVYTQLGQMMISRAVIEPPPEE